MDMPIKGPMPRWQRKNLEASNASINQSINSSLLLQPIDPVQCNVSVTYCSASSLNGCSRTPSVTPTRIKSNKSTPNRSLSSKINNSTKLAKTPKTPGGDRYIPNRNNLNVDVSHFLINQASKENEEDSPRQRNRARAIDEALNGDLSTYRIINCQDRGPRDTFKTIYSSHKSQATVKKAGRSISSQPDRILDAPDIVNDYYLQLVDWSDTNVLAVALNGEVYLWNATSGDIVNLLQLPDGDYVTSVSWIEGGNTLAVGNSQHEIQLWDADANKRLRMMRGHSSRVSSLAWNSHILSSGSRDGAIYNHDVRVASHHVGSFQGHIGEVCGLKWQPGGQYLASGGNDNTVFIWPNTMSHNTDTVRPVHRLTKHTAAVKALAWCPWKSSVLATGGGTSDRHIRLWNATSGTETAAIDTKSQVCGLLWSKTYKELMSAHGHPSNDLIIWKYPELNKFQTLEGHTGRVLGMAMNPEGNVVVSAAADETLRFWECFTADKTKKQDHYQNDISSSALRLSIR